MGYPSFIAQAANRVDDVADAAKGATTAMQRGIANEAKTLDYLGETKNTKSFTVTLDNGTVKTTIPDFNNATTIGEIKDVKHLSNTSQIRAEAKAATESGKNFVIYTGPKTQPSNSVKQLYDLKFLDWLGPQK